MENKKLFMDGMGIKSMLWMGAMGIAFVNADPVDNLTGTANWQSKNITCEENKAYVGYDYCSKYGYTYYTGNCALKSDNFVNEGEGSKSYRMCAWMQAVKLANYILENGQTGQDEAEILKETCVPKTTEVNGYDYQDYNCDTEWYGYMDQKTLNICTSQLGLIKAAGGTDGEGWGKYSYDVCSFQSGTYVKDYYGVGAAALSEKMVKQARDAKQQVTNDEAKNAAKEKEDRESRNEAKEGRLKVQECSDAIKNGDTKDKFFCFNGAGGERFFNKDLKEWGKYLIEKVNIEINGKSKEVEVKVWPTCGGVDTPCGKTTDETEYFTKNGNYVLLKENAADDSKGKGKETHTNEYEKREELKYTLAIQETIAKCEESDSGICKLVSNPNFTEVMQPILEQQAKDDANEEEKKLAAEQARKEQEQIERIQRETEYYKKQLLEREAEKKLVALEKKEEKLEGELIEQENAY